MSEITRYTRESVRRAVLGLLQAASIFERDADTVVAWLLRTECEPDRPAADGLRLLPGMLGDIAVGAIDPRGRPLVMTDTPSLRLLDGSGAVGPVAAAAAADWLTEVAPHQGMATALIKNGRRLGDPAAAAALLADAGLIGVCVTGVTEADGCRMRSAVVSPAASSDEGQPVRRWQGPPSALLEALIAGLTGGRLLRTKADSPNPSMTEHLLVAIHGDAAAGDARFRGRLAEQWQSEAAATSPSDGELCVRPPDDQPVAIDAETLEALRQAAKELDADFTPVAA